MRARRDADRNVRGPHTVDVIALDQGPGIRILNMLLEDGNSSAGTAGPGLGRDTAAEYRVRNLFASRSRYAVIATIGHHLRTISIRSWSSLRPVKAKSIVAMAGPFGQTVNKQQIMLVDGLGHGTDAYTAALQAMQGSPVAREVWIRRIFRTLLTWRCVQRVEPPWPWPTSISKPAS